MAPPLANSTATDGNIYSQPKIGKQDPSSTSSQDLGQGFNKSHSSIYAMGMSNPDTNLNQVFYRKGVVNISDNSENFKNCQQF